MKYLKDSEELYFMASDEIMKLARHFNWNRNKMQQGWIEANEEQRL
jgi:hypothetical protein